MSDSVSRLAKRAEQAYYMRDREELLRVCKAYDEEIANLRAQLAAVQLNTDPPQPENTK